MGDMADMLMWDDRDLYGEDDQPSPPAFITCRYCDARHLGWGALDGKWRLFEENGKMHQCKVKPLSEPPKPIVVTDPVEKAFRAGFDVGFQTAMEQAHPEVGPGPMSMSVEEAFGEYLKP